MIGEAGRYTQKYGIKIDECHGLDPAGPFFDGCDESIRLTKNDCRLVQVIHTSAGVVPSFSTLTLNLGTYYKSGHCDYWINCGHRQEPCYDMKYEQLIKGTARLLMLSDGEIQSWAASRVCSHWRATEVYTSNVERQCPFRAYPCPDCAKIGVYHECKATVYKAHNNTMIPFGTCSPESDENYYVESGSMSPYCDTTWGEVNNSPPTLRQVWEG